MTTSTLQETIEKVNEKYQIDMYEQVTFIESISYNGMIRYCLFPNYTFSKLSKRSKKMIQVIISRLDNGRYELVSYIN